MASVWVCRLHWRLLARRPLTSGAACTTPAFTAGVVGFGIEQRGLARQSPAIAGERPALLYDAMTRNRQRDRVRRAGARDGAHRTRRTDGFGDVRIASRLAVGNPTQCVPDALAERRCVDIERQVETLAGAVQISVHLRDERCEPGGILDQLGVGELAVQLRCKRARVVTEADLADAFGGGRHQHETQRGRRAGVMHGQPCALAPEGGRRHAQFGRRAFVHTRRRAEAGVDGGARDIRPR